MEQDSLEGMRSLRAALRRAGLKATPQRLEVFREVSGSVEHPDVEAVLRGVRRKLPSISLDTVYRTIRTLLDLGLVSCLGRNGDRLRLDANHRSHHHFVCRACGLTRDVYSEAFDHLKVPESVRTWGAVDRTHVEFQGLCAACASTSLNPKTAGKQKTIKQRRRLT